MGDKDRITTYEQCCTDNGEWCPDDSDDSECESMLTILQKDHAQCCADDGEDCPEDSEDTCRRLKPLMPKKVLLMDKDRITTYEQCCKNTGEWCPDDSDCESMLSILQKDHAQCCADDGEDCPEDSDHTCDRLESLIQKKVLLMDKDRITTYEQCCLEDGEDCPEDSEDTCRRLKSIMPTY